MEFVINIKKNSSLKNNLYEFRWIKKKKKKETSKNRQLLNFLDL